MKVNKFKLAEYALFLIRLNVHILREKYGIDRTKARVGVIENFLNLPVEKINRTIEVIRANTFILGYDIELSFRDYEVLSDIELANLESELKLSEGEKGLSKISWLKSASF